VKINITLKSEREREDGVKAGRQTVIDNAPSGMKTGNLKRNQSLNFKITERFYNDFQGLTILLLKVLKKTTSICLYVDNREMPAKETIKLLPSPKENPVHLIQSQKTLMLIKLNIH
jgi:hypothetical protein